MARIFVRLFGKRDSTPHSIRTTATGAAPTLVASWISGEVSAIPVPDQLQDIIHRLYGAKTQHIDSVPVREVVQGRTIWDGTVEIFNLFGHPKANRIYAWIQITDDHVHSISHVTVPHIPPVVSPETAVKAIIPQAFRNLPSGSYAKENWTATAPK